MKKYKLTITDPSKEDFIIQLLKEFGFVETSKDNFEIKKSIKKKPETKPKPKPKKPNPKK